MQRPDSLIFDMDGTLWDAVNTYLISWNMAMELEGIDRVFTRAELDFVMGWERARVLAHLFPDQSVTERERLFAIINKCRAEIIPRLGGTLYEGVQEGIIKLAEKYKLFIVSNCPEGLIVEFIKWSGLERQITDEIAHGLNSMPKNYNINLLMDKHQLKNPIYIGDTDVDRIESRKAGVPFVLLTYGFGTSDDYDLKFDDFFSLTDYFMML